MMSGTLFRLLRLIGRNDNEMKEIQEEQLHFVARHWKAGRFDPKRAWRRFRATEGTERRIRPVWGYALATALAAVVLGLFLFRETPQTVIPATADIHSIVLPDGTHATLAPEATLTFRRHGFGRRDRAVYQTGKVFYAVEHNEALPFEIMAAEGFVRVLGTRFQVTTDGAGTAVDVVDGRVLFAAARAGSAKIIWEEDGLVLSHGMHAELSPGATTPVLTEPQTANPAAWATHTFRYADTPLEDVLRELSIVFGCTFRTDGSDRSLTGEFEGDEPGEIISLIEEALDIRIEIR
jgi:ferric-dicitrate binding protein FerR (iron transport regulator)